ncbi:MAG: putative transrane anti-sigma factor [Hyphomicrobiales bacterium]|nr:putative transrane anti-sigma factor [Hyphomicrobiales bacterium]
MKSPERTINDAELNALVDGELLPERRAQVESWLTDQPEAAARVESWRRQNDILRAAFSRIAHEAVPQALALAIAGPKAQSTLRTVPLAPAEPAIAPLSQVSRIGLGRTDQQRRTIGFTVLAFLCGGLTTLAAATAIGVMHRAVPSPIPIAATALPPSSQSFARRALEAEAAFGRGNSPQLDLASHDALEISLFLSERLQTRVRLPDFEPSLKPAGVRLTPGEVGLAGFVLYDGDSGGRTGVLVGRTAGADTTGFLTRESAGRVAVWFVASGVAYGLTGASRDRLVDHALTLRERLGAARAGRE